MGTIGDRIRQIRKARNISGTELEKRTGIRSEYICKIENNSLKNITYFTMLKISNGLEISISDLVTEELIPELPGLRVISADGPGNYEDKVNRIKVAPIPYITNENCRCLSGSCPAKIKNSEIIFFPCSWLKAPDDYQRYRCIKLSKFCRIMSPVIEPGSTLCIDLKQNNLETLEGKIIAVLYENELSVGYLRKEKDNYMLLPKNLKEYIPMIMSPHTEKIILGKVVWSLTTIDEP